MINLDNIEEFSTLELKKHKEVINKELALREKHTLRSNLWCKKLKITKELAFRIKK